jgi:hypothetical protein
MWPDRRIIDLFKTNFDRAGADGGRNGRRTRDAVAQGGCVRLVVRALLGREGARAVNIIRASASRHPQYELLLPHAGGADAVEAGF